MACRLSQVAFVSAVQHMTGSICWTVATHDYLMERELRRCTGEKMSVLDGLQNRLASGTHQASDTWNSISTSLTLAPLTTQFRRPNTVAQPNAECRKKHAMESPTGANEQGEREMRNTGF